jgi:hypothetical protein
MKRKFLSLVAIIVVALSLNSFTTVSETGSKSQDVYIDVLGANSFELVNTTGIAVDSWRVKVTFYDVNNNILETERYSGDDFPPILDVCSETPDNCKYVNVYLWARLLDDRVFTYSVKTESDC